MYIQQQQREEEVHSNYVTYSLSPSAISQLISYSITIDLEYIKNIAVHRIVYLPCRRT